MNTIFNMQILYLGGNQLEHLPDDIGKLFALTMLYLGDNKLSCVPTTLSYLSRLTTLNLHNNLLTSLPTDVCYLITCNIMLNFFVFRCSDTNMQILNLVNLRQLSLRGNPLVSSFIQDMPLQPPSLLELCARQIRKSHVPVSFPLFFIFHTP